MIRRYGEGDGGSSEKLGFGYLYHYYDVFREFVGLSKVVKFGGPRVVFLSLYK